MKPVETAGIPEARSQWDMRGRVMGVWSFVFGAMIPLGSLEAGALADWIGTQATIAFGAIICALAAFITLLIVRRRELVSNLRTT